MNIREIKLEDAENFAKLIIEVENQAHFMLYGAGERKTTTEKQRKQLEVIEKSPNSTIFVAEETTGRLVGYAFAIGSTAKRKKHSVYLAIGILEEFTGKGLGTKLFQALEEWAINHSIFRLELTVVKQNEVAVGLYKKMGYQIEGTKINSLIIDGKRFDEYYMAKIL
ncbi:GNAT family N-acetyltransferase [Bacillus sp. AFS053548]|uniref:GNAT family N-acetyltransferase n=1 Tax=Bacillus sp. AFS053548 TaxID=2033505 RepID=UPI000BFCF75B|nr:GNAT family N-acetyltransferase [Bacillus sp. AFS053548]PGM51027.1 GNAT family N-acetyltransferase [Bacillus sp. AFS053548]